MSTKLFLKKFIKNSSEIGSIKPSSSFLAKKMVNPEDIKNSNVIVEFGAGTGIFTKYIFKYVGDDSNKKVFIIEKDPDLYKLLLKKFPKHKENIHNIDILFLDKLLDEHEIVEIDLVISGLPFRSLPKEVFSFVTDIIFVKYLTKDSKFIQFSYFKSTVKKLHKYFENIDIDICLLNLPIAYIFTCNNYKKGSHLNLSSE